jgi:thiol:disulfide interchange protein DsbC
MMQVNIPITVKTLAAGAGLLAASVFCANLLFSPTTVTQLDAQAMRLVTADGTFKTVQGDGSRAIHVFLSTDCSFCHKIEPELGRLDNVTVYRHLLPGHTEGGRISAVDVWCAANPVQAWKTVAAGQTTSPAKCDGSAIEKNLALAKRLGLTMTPTIVYEDGNVSAGMLSSGEIATRTAKAAKG